MTEIYHCTPTEFYKQDTNIVNMHAAFLGMRNEKNEIELKRQEQRMRRNVRR